MTAQSGAAAVDEFDMLAQSRNVNYDTPSKTVQKNGQKSEVVSMTVSWLFTSYPFCKYVDEDDIGTHLVMENIFIQYL